MYESTHPLSENMCTSGYSLLLRDGPLKVMRGEGEPKEFMGGKRKRKMSCTEEGKEKNSHTPAKKILY